MLVRPLSKGTFMRTVFARIQFAILVLSQIFTAQSFALTCGPGQVYDPQAINIADTESMLEALRMERVPGVAGSARIFLTGVSHSAYLGDSLNRTTILPGGQKVYQASRVNGTIKSHVLGKITDVLNLHPASIYSYDHASGPGRVYTQYEFLDYSGFSMTTPQRLDALSFFDSTGTLRAGKLTAVKNLSDVVTHLVLTVVHRDNLAVQKIKICHRPVRRTNVTPNSLECARAEEISIYLPRPNLTQPRETHPTIPAIRPFFNANAENQIQFMMPRRVIDSAPDHNWVFERYSISAGNFYRTGDLQGSKFSFEIPFYDVDSMGNLFFVRNREAFTDFSHVGGAGNFPSFEFGRTQMRALVPGVLSESVLLHPHMASNALSFNGGYKSIYAVANGVSGGGLPRGTGGIIVSELQTGSHALIFDPWIDYAIANNLGTVNEIRILPLGNTQDSGGINNQFLVLYRMFIRASAGNTEGQQVLSMAQCSLD